MKATYTKKLLTVLGFLVLTFVAVNMNACSKDKPNNNQNVYGQYGQYGNHGPGGPILGNAIGTSPDGKTLRLTITGMNGGSAGANGELFIPHGNNMSCGVPPGRYGLVTENGGAGRYYNGDFYPPMGQGFRLKASNGMPVFVEGFLTMQQDQNGFRRMFANVNIPGCPTMFN